MFKIHFTHLTYMLAKASTISQECIKQYGTELMWSELPLKITDYIKVVFFHLSGISKTILWTDVSYRLLNHHSKSSTVLLFHKQFWLSSHNRGQQSLLVPCWAQITLYSFTVQISEITFPLLIMYIDVWSFPLIHFFAFYSKDCCHSLWRQNPLNL